MNFEINLKFQTFSLNSNLFQSFFFAIQNVSKNMNIFLLFVLEDFEHFFTFVKFANKKKNIKEK